MAIAQKYSTNWPVKMYQSGVVENSVIFETHPISGKMGDYLFMVALFESFQRPDQKHSFLESVRSTTAYATDGTYLEHVYVDV